MQQHRDAALKAFNGRNSVPLDCGHQEEVGLFVQSLKVRIRNEAVEMHSIGDTQRCGQLAQFAD